MIEKHVLPQDNMPVFAYSLPINSLIFEKVASKVYIPDKIANYIKTASARPDGRYVHLVALGAGETWGNNRRGDYFPEWSLLGDKPSEKIANMEQDGVRIFDPAKEYGYLTFEKYGFPFTNHNNKSESVAIGERVKCAAYNEKMHRVELVVFVKTASSPDLVKRLDEGTPVFWSMGCKVPGDQCSICGNWAPKTANYCEHAKFAMGQILPDGRQVYVSNYQPCYFDISDVPVPAAPEAITLQKVASATKVANLSKEQLQILYYPHTLDLDLIMEKQASIRKESAKKISSITKEVPLETEAVVNPKQAKKEQYLKTKHDVEQDDTEDLDSRILSVLKNKYGVTKTVKLLTSLGVVLRPNELKSLLGNEKFPTIDGIEHASSQDKHYLAPIAKKRSMFSRAFHKRKAQAKSKKALKKHANFENANNQDINIRGYYDYLRTLRTSDLVKAANGFDYLDVVSPELSDSLWAIKCNLEVDLVQEDSILPFIVEVKRYVK